MDPRALVRVVSRDQFTQNESAAAEGGQASGEALGCKGPVPGRVLRGGGPFASLRLQEAFPLLSG